MGRQASREGKEGLPFSFSLFDNGAQTKPVTEVATFGSYTTLWGTIEGRAGSICRRYAKATARRQPMGRQASREGKEGLPFSFSLFDNGAQT